MRYSFLRGYKWLLIYYFLAIVPLLIAYSGKLPEHRSFWIEFGVALGFMGLAIFGLQFLFSGRFIKVAPSFGMDNIIQFHREMGLIAFFFVLAHPVILVLRDPSFLSYFDPTENLPRAIALITVIFAMLFLMGTSLWRKKFGLNYEKWRLIHGLLSLVVLFIGLVHSIQVSHYLEPTWKKAILGLLIGICAYLVLHTRITRPMQNRKKPYRIIDVRAERDSCYTIFLKPRGHPGLKFLPGQFVWITIAESPFSLQQHPFSIASASGETTFSITSKEVGDFTKTWRDLPIPSEAYLEGPFGSFTLKNDGPVFFIMGGIGITPAISILRTLKDNGDQRESVLLYGNLNWEDVPFREELEVLEMEMPLKVIHLLEKADNDWEGEKGMLNKDIIARHLPENKQDYTYYICGPGPFMDVAEISLRELGIDWRNIYSERFEMV